MHGRAFIHSAAMSEFSGALRRRRGRRRACRLRGGRGRGAASGARTLLLTHKRATIGEMSCNPAIGGLGKGHLVREIDALDGIMGRAIDRAGIQFRMLNRSKGPAVRGPRAQADRKLYRRAMAELLAETPNLDIVEGAVEDLLRRSRPDTPPASCWGRQSRSQPARVVLTTGTFLNGLIHIGEEKIPAGRVGEAPSRGLAQTLARAGFALGPAQDRHAAAPRRHARSTGPGSTCSRATTRRRRFRF